MKNVNNFQIAKYSLEVLLSISLIFANFSLALLIKVVLMKKTVNTEVFSVKFVGNRGGYSGSMQSTHLHIHFIVKKSNRKYVYQSLYHHQ